MLLGEWWVANPTDTTDGYTPPDPAERVPGTLREVAHGEFVLETIRSLAGPPMAGGPASVSGSPRLEIWGTDRDARCYSLFDNLRTNMALTFGHVSGGGEDWSVGWLAKGDTWVTPDEECSSARIRIDDLHAWALDRRPDNFEFDDSWETATIDLRDETLGTMMIGGTRVSLVRGPHASWGFAEQDSRRQVSFANIVHWKIEGPVKLQTIVNEWIGHFESFVRFMTMEPSVVTGIDCHVGDSGNRRLKVELVAPRLQRDDQTTKRTGNKPPSHKYLATLHTLQELGINPIDAFDGYWRKVAAGDAYIAMVLHLESQDRLLSRGVDSAFLNAIRSVESLYAAQNPEAPVERIPVQNKIDDAVSQAGDIGTQILDAWPELRKTGELRRDVAHGKGRPSANFGLRCLGGATALQWIQRLRLLSELGISETEAHSIVSDNFQYPKDLTILHDWNAELGARPAP